MSRGTVVDLGLLSGWKVSALLTDPLRLAASGRVLVGFAAEDGRGLPLTLARSGHQELARRCNLGKVTSRGSTHYAVPGAERWYSGLVVVQAAAGRLQLTNESLAAALAWKPEVLVVAASDALALGLPAAALLQWLEQGLTGSSGQVVLASTLRADLAAFSSPPRSSEEPGGRRAARVAATAGKLGGAAGGGLVPGLAASVAKLAGGGGRSGKGKTAGAAAIAGGLGLLAGGALAAAAWASSRPKKPEEDAHGLGQWRPKGGTPTSRLAELLLDELGDGPRRNLMHEVNSTLRRGDDLGRLEEWLFEQGDLVPVVTGLLADFELRRIAQERLGFELLADLDGARAARRLLARLGFSSEGRAVGLFPAVQQARALRKALQESRITPRAVGAEMGPTVERVGKELLAFHLRAAFDTATDPGRLLLRVTTDWEGGPFEGMTIGAIAEALGQFDRWRQTGVERGALERHRELYGLRPLSDEQLEIVRAERTQLSHERSGAADGLALEAAAVRLLDASLRWFARLHAGKEGPRLFPAVVRVERAVHDEKGLLLFGIDDEGKQEEIRPDGPVQVGSRWYMVPRTNPIRIRPLLIPVC